MFIRVSARLQAKAAPDAPEPTINTSTGASDMTTLCPMQSIAEATGGTAFVPDSDKDLERVFSEVAAELRGQYLVQYYSNSQSPGGQFRTIAVSVPSHSELRIRARQGYYPKSK